MSDMITDEGLAVLAARPGLPDDIRDALSDAAAQLANAEASLDQHGEVARLNFLHLMSVEADRDRLAAANAALEAQVARLVGTYWKLRSYAIHDDDCKLNKPPYKVGSCSCGLSKELKDGEIAALAALRKDEETPK